MPPAITQDHIDLITRIARNLARTPFGKHAGTDELESQALVTLWELALTWDDTRGVPFDAYVAVFARLTGTCATHLVDELPYNLWDDTPGPADAVVARDELQQVLACAAEVCSERERAALLSLLADDLNGALEDTCTEWAMSRNSALTHRTHARRKIRASLAS